MNKKIIIIIAAVLVLAIVGVLLYLFVFSSSELPFVRTQFSPGEYFVVNAVDTGRFLKVTVTLILDTDTLEEMLTAEIPTIRDTIHTVLRSKNEADFRAADWTPIKQEIIAAVNERLEFEHVIDVLFNDYVVQ